ncbi:hypothetical protein SNE40_017541 [Patella caerulea]|uniref:KRAB-A domain-containing protein 2-like n=1 Tax=Patella caerulea TaxID=87958 RepID=A0AAN8P9W1_PATCE
MVVKNQQNIEHSFDIIQKAHIATGHGGRDKMMKELSKKYANITQEAVTIFKSSRVPCQLQQNQTQNQHQLKMPLKPDKKKFRPRVSVLQNPSCKKLRRWCAVRSESW